jgi:hypothetical protein
LWLGLRLEWQWSKNRLSRGSGSGVFALLGLSLMLFAEGRESGKKRRQDSCSRSWKRNPVSKAGNLHLSSPHPPSSLVHHASWHLTIYLAYARFGDWHDVNVARASVDLPPFYYQLVFTYMYYVCMYSTRTPPPLLQRREEMRLGLLL